MAIQIIDIGVTPNDGTGDTLHDAFRKENENWQFVQDIIDNDPASLQAIVATEQAAIATAAASTATSAAISASEDASTASSARDAALIQSGVYSDVAAGMADVATGEAFKVQGSGDIAAYEYRKAVSPNLFDTATVRDGYYISSVNGNIGAFAGWKISAFIPVTEGLQYTLSGTRGWTGFCFYSSATDIGATIFSSYNDTVAPFTVTAPAGATHAVIQLANPGNPSFSNVQFEQSAVATAYSAYGTITAELLTTYPSKAYVDSFPVDGLATLSLSESGESYIKPNIGGDDFKMHIGPFEAATHDNAGVFSFGYETLDGVTHRPSGDDVAPYWVLDTQVGARHGYPKTVCTVTAHGKGYADVGSIYADGFAAEWVIVDIPSIDTIAITKRSGYTAFTTGTLTHVSGGTVTTAFTPSGVSQSSFYPVFKNRTMDICVDDAPVTDYEREYTYAKSVKFVERYDVMTKDSIVEWLITQAGTPTDITAYDGTAAFAATMTYVFDPYGSVTTYCDFLALENIAQFNFLSFNQASKFTAGVDGAVKYYIPKAIPFTLDSISYDFAAIKDMTGVVPYNPVELTPARCEGTGQLVDRIIQMNDSLGMAIGYLPLRDAHPDVRRTNASTSAMQIYPSSALKIYMKCISNSATTSLTAGDYFSAVSYRSFFKRTANRTASYIIRDNGDAYLYCDWHTDTIDRVSLPVDLHGKPYTLIEKSSNVTILSAYTTNSIAFDVSASGSYGYAILKFN